MAVRFCIRSSASRPPSQLTVMRGDMDRLRQWSSQLRSMTEEPRPPEINLQLPGPEEYIDVKSVEYLLHNLGIPDFEPGEEDYRAVDLSRLCNALWYYHCDPATFKVLWHRLRPPLNWNELRRHPLPGYSWRPPFPRPRDILYHANIAWILEQDDYFRRAIRYIVWDSTETSLNHTAIEVAQDIESKLRSHSILHWSSPATE
jgi:hypothetical protein